MQSEKPTEVHVSERVKWSAATQKCVLIVRASCVPSTNYRTRRRTERETEMGAKQARKGPQLTGIRLRFTCFDCKWFSLCERSRAVDGQFALSAPKVLRRCRDAVTDGFAARARLQPANRPCRIARFSIHPSIVRRPFSRDGEMT